jgi:hypothetical protein
MSLACESKELSIKFKTLNVVSNEPFFPVYHLFLTDSKVDRTSPSLCSGAYCSSNLCVGIV